jgi:hypothetical protein
MAVELRGRFNLFPIAGLRSTAEVATAGFRAGHINRLNAVTTVTVRDRNTGKIASETFFGDSPLGKYGVFGKIQTL